MPPDPPSVLAPSALDPIFVPLTLNCFRQVTVSVILRILITQKHFFSLEKGAPFVLYRDTYFKTADIRPAQA